MHSQRQQDILAYRKLQIQSCNNGNFHLITTSRRFENLCSNVHYQSPPTILFGSIVTFFEQVHHILSKQKINGQGGTLSKQNIKLLQSFSQQLMQVVDIRGNNFSSKTISLFTQFLNAIFYALQGGIQQRNKFGC